MKYLYKIYTIIGICCLAISTLNAQSFEWATGTGDTLADVGYSVTTDPMGNVYTTGLFSGTVDFDPGVGATNLISAGETDIFISKLDASGNLVWAVNMGGINFDGGNAITLDSSQNVYVTGFFQGSASFGSYNLVSAGNYDVFVTKLDNSGNFLEAISMGGPLSDFGNSIAVDASGNIYITGSFEGTADFDPDAVDVNNLISQGANDIFISKLDASTNFIGAGKMGGTLADEGNSVILDSSGNIFITGSFEGTSDFDPKAGTHNLTTAGGKDVFIAKLDASGNFLGAGKMGGMLADEGNSVILDASGNIYVTGFFEGTADLDPKVGIFNLPSAGGKDIFVSKLDATGNFLWAKNMGGTSDDLANSVAVDTSGNVYTIGAFEGTADFDPGAGIYNLISSGITDIFISKLNASGTFMNAKSMEGTGNDHGFCITIDATNNIYATGSFMTTVDFDPGSGIHNLISAGDFDIFILKL